MAEENKQPGGDGVLRLDTYSLGRAERTPAGGLRIPARLTRTGVFSYRLPDGSTRRELRLPEEVFKADSMASLKGAVVTDLHPRSGVVTSETYKRDSVGHVEEPKQDGRFISADVVVNDAATVAKIEAGERREISCGYRCDLEAKSGEWNGERYDAIQRNVVYNHTAVGPRGWGRAGSEVSLRVDGADIPCAFNDAGAGVKTIRIDGTDYEVGSDSHLAKLDSLNTAALAAKDAEISALRKDVETGKARTDSLESEAKKLKADLAEATDQKRIDSLVAERASFIAAATAVLGQDVKLDGKTDREVMVEAIRCDDKDFDDKGRSDDYVRARFDILAERGGSRGDSIDSVVRRSAQFRGDSVDDDEAKARRERAERAQNAWKPKPAK